MASRSREKGAKGMSGPLLETKRRRKLIRGFSNKIFVALEKLERIQSEMTEDVSALVDEIRDEIEAADAKGRRKP